MNVVDSSGWLEYFAEASNADFFAEPITNLDELIVPSITIYEVFKRVLQQSGEGQALQVIVSMQQGEVIDLDSRIALSAAKFSATLKIPMADSIILATARMHNAIIWTQDVDFKELENVRYIRKK